MLLTTANNPDGKYFIKEEILHILLRDYLVTLPAYSKHRLYIIYFAIFLTIGNCLIFIQTRSEFEYNLGLYCLMTLFTVIKMNTFKEFFTVKYHENDVLVRLCSM